MMPAMRERTAGILTVMLSLMLCGSRLAADGLPAIEWAGRDVAGQAVKVPADRASIIAFVRADQEQSLQALKEISQLAAKEAAQQENVITLVV